MNLTVKPRVDFESYSNLNTHKGRVEGNTDVRRTLILVSDDEETFGKSETPSLNVHRPRSRLPDRQ